MTISGTFTQFFPPKASFTEKNIDNLQGKTYIVTGSNTGIGKQVARILFSKNAKVYIAARSEEKALAAITDIKQSAPNSQGQLVFLKLDLSDLTTIKASANEFLAKEPKLHVLFNNAGIQAPLEPKSVQGYDLQIAVNNLGPFLFTKLLMPVLLSTARSEQKNTVRIVWTSSAGAEMGSPKPGGVDMSNLDYHIEKSLMFKYGVSKAGNYLHAVEFLKRYGRDGVTSVALNPGNLSSDLYRDQPAFFRFVTAPIMHPPINGAYTELFAGLSPEVRAEKLGTDWIIPWGRVYPMGRRDIADATKSEAEGGSGIGSQWWDWCEKQVKPYT